MKQCTKKTENDNGSSVIIHHITIDAAQFDWPDTKIPVINIEANMAADNHLDYAILETVDKKLRAEIAPKEAKYLIQINAKNWTLPVGLPLQIDSAKLEGDLNDNKLTFSSIDTALYGGKLTGDAVLNWGKDWRANGKLKVDHLSVKEPSSMVSKSVYLSGNLFGNGNFSANAKNAGQLADNLRADFRFKVNGGVLHGLDLVKAASLLIKQGQRGGETEFNEFSGLLNVSGKQYHLRDMKISSGLLAATGQVKIKPNKTLDGAVQVEVKRSVSLAAIPLEVSGTLSNPVVLPSKAALAGAIAGTAILGPGVGTSLGIKAGSAVDKIKGLFGSKK